MRLRAPPAGAAALPPRRRQASSTGRTLAVGIAALTLLPWLVLAGVGRALLILAGGFLLLRLPLLRLPLVRLLLVPHPLAAALFIAVVVWQHVAALISDHPPALAVLLRLGVGGCLAAAAAAVAALLAELV